MMRVVRHKSTSDIAARQQQQQQRYTNAASISQLAYDDDDTDDALYDRVHLKADIYGDGDGNNRGNNEDNLLSRSPLLLFSSDNAANDEDWHFLAATGNKLDRKDCATTLFGGGAEKLQEKKKKRKLDSHSKGPKQTKSAADFLVLDLAPIDFRSAVGGAEAKEQRSNAEQVPSQDECLKAALSSPALWQAHNNNNNNSAKLERAQTAAKVSGRRGRLSSLASTATKLRVRSGHHCNSKHHVGRHHHHHHHGRELWPNNGHNNDNWPASVDANNDSVALESSCCCTKTKLNNVYVDNAANLSQRESPTANTNGDHLNGQGSSQLQEQPASAGRRLMANNDDDVDDDHDYEHHREQAQDQRGVGATCKSSDIGQLAGQKPASASVVAEPKSMSLAGELASGQQSAKTLAGRELETAESRSSTSNEENSMPLRRMADLNMATTTTTTKTTNTNKPANGNNQTASWLTLRKHNKHCYEVANRHHQLPPESELRRPETVPMAAALARDTTTTRRARRQLPPGSRPARSPASLQRQTNARLARHRLKIQQQRQEQLANLALRERAQLSHLSYCTYRNPSRIEQQQQQQQQLDQIEVLSTSSLHNRTNDHLLDGSGQQRTILSTLIRKLSFNKFLNNDQEQAHVVGLPLQHSGQHQQQQQPTPRTRNNLSQASNRFLASNRNQQHNNQQQDTIIEICDNQLASTSNQNNNPTITIASLTNEFIGENDSRLPNNLIIYNSMNVRNENSTTNMQQQQQQQQPRKQHTTQYKYNNNNHHDTDTLGSNSTSSSTLSLNRPFCKICHVGSSKDGDKLISPCRCSGTMQYIHCGCLLKWLELSNRAHEKPMSCELCSHEYTWHKKFNYKRMRLPKCSIKDLFLHLVFILAISTMFLCALAPMLNRKSPIDKGNSIVMQQTSATSTSTIESFSQPQTTISSNDKRQKDEQINHDSNNINQHRHNNPSSSSFRHTFGGYPNHLSPTGRLASDEKFMLICAAFFFISFFLAIYVETKARDTLYGLCVKFAQMNQTYYITEYDHGHWNSSSNNNTNTSNTNTSNNNNVTSNQDSDSTNKNPQQQFRCDRKFLPHKS